MELETQPTDGWDVGVVGLKRSEALAPLGARPICEAPALVLQLVAELGLGLGSLPSLPSPHALPAPMMDPSQFLDSPHQFSL